MLDVAERHNISAALWLHPADGLPRACGRCATSRLGLRPIRRSPRPCCAPSPADQALSRSGRAGQPLAMLEIPGAALCSALARLVGLRRSRPPASRADPSPWHPEPHTLGYTSSGRSADRDGDWRAHAQRDAARRCPVRDRHFLGSAAPTGSSLRRSLRRPDAADEIGIAPRTTLLSRASPDRTEAGQHSVDAGLR